MPALPKSALRIKLGPELIGGWKRIVGAIYRMSGHTMPLVLRALRPTLISQTNRIIEYLPKDPPIHLFARLGERASMDRLGVRPKAKNSGMSKEFTGFHVHSFTLSTGGNGQDEGDKLSKGEFSVSSKVLRRAFLGRVDLSGNNVKKFFSVRAKLAWFFKA
ncbi:hypothetical protein [Desulfomonile tiedjei]|uniref:hypothetical protein n=1 Tax=Desulfomonile tiedjei TaxID=2358 RepID=UPI00059C208A|nr:hypothetical protein [Desulfomonile tiedjei]